MTVPVVHPAVESPLDYLTDEHRLKILNDVHVWKNVDRFVEHWAKSLRKHEGMFYFKYRSSAPLGILTRDISEYLNHIQMTSKRIGEVFRRAGVYKEQHRVPRGGKRLNFKYYDPWEIVGICNWLRERGEVGSWVGSASIVHPHELDFEPFVSATYRRKQQQDKPPCKDNQPNPPTAQPSPSDHLSSSTTSNIISLQDYKASAKDIFHSYLPSHQDELYWIDLEMLSGDGLYPQYVSLAHRLIDYATYDPANHCLEMHYNPNRHGYSEWTESLFNSLADGLDMTYDDMLTLSISRFMCVTANPQCSWKTTRGAESPGRILEDDDTIAHHICRNPACISPLHLKPLPQEAHVLLHSYCAETNHPALNPSSYVEDDEKLDEEIEKLEITMVEIAQRLNSLKERQILDQTITSFRPDTDPFDEQPL